MFSTNSLLKEQLCGKLANFWDKHISDLASPPVYPGMLTEKQDSSGQHGGQPRVKGGTITHLLKGFEGTVKKIQSSVQLYFLEESLSFRKGKKVLNMPSNAQELMHLYHSLPCKDLNPWLFFILTGSWVYRGDGTRYVRSFLSPVDLD